MSRIVRAATAHISPVVLSSSQTTQKVISHIQRAARRQANVLCFPESLIPAFPVWSSFLPPSQTHHFFQRMAQESIYADGEEMGAICHAAATAKMVVSLGFSEKVPYSSATLFNSNVIIDTQGRVVVHHRKLMPTWFEKLTWSPGDGRGLSVASTPHGKVGALICGENTNPLARYVTMAQGEEIHISSWPAIWPSRVGPSSAGKNYDNVAANRIRAAAHCFEAKCFGIVCAASLNRDTVDAIAAMCDDEARARYVLDTASRAASMFLDPTGSVVPGHVVDEQTGEKQEKDFLQHDEDILYADLDLDQCIEGKQYHDVVGGYQRLDVFDLKVNVERRHPVRFHGRGDD